MASNPPVEQIQHLSSCVSRPTAALLMRSPQHDCQLQAAFDRQSETVNGSSADSVIEKPSGKPTAVLQAGGQTTLLVLNDRTPDAPMCPGFDVDGKLVERAGQSSGDRVYDMVLRPLQPWSGTLQLIVSRFDRRSPLPCHKHLLVKPLHILPTYSAMLEVRQVLTGRKIS